MHFGDRMYRTCLFMAAVLTVQTACAISTDNGTFSMDILAVSLGASDTLDEAVFAEGTELCFNCSDVNVEDLDCGNVGACLQWQVAGADLGEERCMPDSLPGEATLDIVPVDCLNAPDLASDSRTFEWVETNQLNISAQDYWTDLAERAVAEGLARTIPAWTSDWGHPEGTPWTLIADQPYSVYVQIHDGQGRPVAWDTRQGSFDITASGSGSMAGRTGNAYATITLASGASGTLHYALNEQVWDAAELTTATIDEAVSLEIVTGFAALTDEDAGYDTPLAARAVVRTADGTPLYGAPVSWSVQAGSVLLSTVDTQETDTGIPPLPGYDHVLISDACEAPEDVPSQHTATLVATLGSLSATTDLVWAIPPGDPNAFVPDPACEETSDPTTSDSGLDSATTSDNEGCGCDQTPSRTPAALVLLVLVLIRWRRS